VKHAVLEPDVVGDGDQREGRAVLGGAAFDGDVDTPLASMLGTTMKYRRVSSAWSGPIRYSLSLWRPPKRVGRTTTLSRSAESSP